ncbi:MAG: hypothetical protein GYA21_17955 [Myxococcales bacterium]|nr:hypothetical protein [Myxococcales bacterium]
MLRVAAALLAVMLGACRPEADPLFIRGGGAGLLFEVEGRAGSQRAMLEAVRERLRSEGVGEFSAEAVGQRGLRVLLPGLDGARAREVEQLLLQPLRIDIAAVDDGEEYFAALRRTLGEGESVQVRFDAYAPGRATGYLQAAEARDLDDFLAVNAPPPGRRFARMRAPAAVLAFLISDPPEIQNPVLRSLQALVEPEHSPPAVRARLAPPFRQGLSELTRRMEGRRMAILVSDRIRALPRVERPSDDGSLRIEPSPIVAEEAARVEARALAAGLNAWGLSRSLRLLRREITHPGPVAAGL